MRSALFAFGISLIVVCAVQPPARAQLSSGSITGTISDQSGAVLPAVAVTATNTATGVARSTLTNELGVYSFLSLPPGTYRITATKPGFKQATVENLGLTVDQQLRRDIGMELGTQTEHVTVEAAMATVGTEAPTMGTIVTSQQAVELPLNGRSFLQLAAISTGVSSPGTAQGESVSTAYSRRPSTAISISGQREYTTDYRFDGIPSKDRVYGPVGMQFDVDAVAEFNIQRGYAPADTGVSGRINLVTKSGTNEYHGSAWEFVRNDIFDARNFFAAEKLPLRRNQFGASVGGPILQNKLFFFGDYEGLRLRQSTPSLGRVPDPQTLQGNFGGLAPVIDPQTGAPFPGNVIPESRISRFAQNYRQFIPAPNAAGEQNRSIATRLLQDDNKYNGRIDYAFSSNDMLFGRYTHVNSEVTNEAFAPLGGTQSPLRARNAVVGWTHIFGPRVLNDFRVGLNRTLNFPYLPQGAESNPNFRELFGFTNLNELPQCNGLPAVSLLGFNSLGSQSLCIALTNNDYHFIENLSVVRGRHRLSFGAEITRVFMRQVVAVWGQGTLTFSGQYSGNPVADFLLGTPNIATGQDYSRIPDRRATWQSYYINDEYRLNRQLTLSLGLRYDYFQPLAEDAHRLVSFDPFVPGGGFLYEEGSGLENLGRIGPKGLFFPDRNNFAPRVGIAWGPTDNFAIRSSYGIFYQEPGGNRLNTQQTGPPFVNTTSLTGERTVPTIDLDAGNIFPRQGPPFRTPGVSSFGYDPNARTPYLQVWTFSVQKSLPFGIFTEAAYIGSKGTKLDKLDDINVAHTPPPPGFTGTLQSRRPFPDFGFVLYGENRANSSYNSLQLTVRKNLSHGLMFLTNYTYGKSLDWDSFDSKGCRCYIPGASGKARSVFDQRHRGVFSWTYQFPTPSSGSTAMRLLAGGWQLTGITTLQSGFPFHALTGRDYSNRLTTFGSLPLRICNGNLSPSQRRPERWFDTSCFIPPPENTLGNSGWHVLDSDGVINQDLGIIKHFPIREQVNVEFRTEFFNLFNHPNFRVPNNTVENPLFGRVLGALDGRIIQFGARVQW